MSIISRERGLAQSRDERVSLQIETEQRAQVDKGTYRLDDLLGDRLVETRLEQNVVDEEKTIAARAHDLQALEERRARGQLQLT